MSTPTNGPRSLQPSALVICDICSGRGQVAPGTACPPCEGKGMATPEAVAKYRQVMYAATVEGAASRFREAAAQTADGWLQAQAGARLRLTEAVARSEEAAARLEAAAARWEAPDPTDPPPGVVLPAGMGGEIMYYDSLLVRQLDVWGSLNAASQTPVFLSPSGDVTGVKDVASINAVIGSFPVFTLNASGPTVTTAAGTVYLGPGNWYIGSTVTVPPWVTIIGSGPGTVINSLVNGDCFFQQNGVPSGLSNGLNYTTGKSGGIQQLTIDGTSAGANGCGIHTDSMPERLLIDQVWIQNFTGASAIGLHMSNNTSYTENYHVRAQFYNCTLGVMMEKLTGGSESFRYGELDLAFFALAGQSCMVMQAAHLYFGRLAMRANMMSSAVAGPANWSMLYMTPTAVGGTFAQIQDCEVCLYGEIDLGLANAPMDINFGSALNNSIAQCYGAMAFQNGFTNSNAVASNISFWGPIGNDTNLQAIVQQPTQVTLPDFTTAPQAITTPAVPGTGVVVTNNNASAGQTADVLIYVAGGTMTAPTQVNGVNVGDVNARFFYVPSGQTIKMTYSAAPTSWKWVGV